MKTQLKNDRKNDRKRSLYTKKGFMDTMNKCIMDLLEDFNTSRSLALAISFRNESYKTVDLCLLKELDPYHFDDAHSLHVHKQSIALFKKSSYIAYDGDAIAESMDHFFKVDSECLVSDYQVRTLKGQQWEIVNTAREIMSNILGEIPKYDEIFRELVITSGSVGGIGGDDVNIVTKLEDFAQLPVSRAATPFLSYLLKDPLVASIYRNNVPADYAELFSVPKQYNKVRVAAKSQIGNMLLQRPIGLFIGKKLKQRCGIDISTQQEFHKFLVTSFHDVYATIDQSDASDRICVELCKALLPYDWFRLLNLTRHRYLKVKGSESLVSMHKMANQGNGFIFELQTLIYYSLAKATVIVLHGEERASKTLISVFGDDMICEEVHAAAIAQSLEFCGQKINFEKSYFSGRFKESCGVDTFDGFNVRAKYIKQFSSNLRGLYELTNFIRSLYDCNLIGGNRNILDIRAYKRCINAIEDKHVVFGNVAYGDACLHACSSDTDILKATNRKWRFGYWKRGTYYQPLLIEAPTGQRSREWKDKWYRRPTMTDDTAIKRAFLLTQYPGPVTLSQEIKRLQDAVIVYALLGYDSNGTLSRGSPSKYIISSKATLWKG